MLFCVYRETVMEDDDEVYLNDENDPTHVTKVEDEETTIQDDEQVQDDVERVASVKVLKMDLKKIDTKRVNMLIKSMKEGKLK